MVLNELGEYLRLDSDARRIYRDLSGVKRTDPKSLEKAVLFLTSVRNRNLISTREQDILRKSVVAFFGLSVGSNAATSWMMVSRAAAIKISDPDVISLSNLNRLRYGLRSLGESKANRLAHELREINPYCRVHRFSGSGTETIKKIILQKPRPQVIVDEMDDLAGKILVRKLSRRLHLPVVMATDVGDNVMLDIERHDLSSTIPFFGGRVKKIEEIDLARVSPEERFKMALDIVGFEGNSEKMLQSLQAVGKTLKTWPQLGSTATVCGGIVATAIKKIILGEKIKSGRFKFMLDEIMVSDYNTPSRVNSRRKAIEQVLQLD